MEDLRLYPRYRFVSGVCNLFCLSLTHIVFLMVSPILVYLASDFQVDIATAGYASTLHILAMGVFLLIGPMIIGKIDCHKTQLIGVMTMVVGLLLGCVVKSFPLFLVSRFITGMGHGISGSCTNTVIAAWFPPREKSVVITVDSLGIVGVTTLSYTCVVPLYHAFGESWRAVMLLMAGILFVTGVCWGIFYRDNQVMNAYLRERSHQEGKRITAFSGMSEALRRRDVWLVCLFMGLASIGSNGINTYLPQFLQTVRGYTDQAASAVVGVSTGIGAIGTFLGGVVTTAIGKRKIIIIPCAALGIACLVCSVLSGNAALIGSMFFGYTMLTNLRTPASQTVSTELKNVTPTLASAAAAMSFGIGFIGTFICAPLYQFALNTLGEELSMMVFIPLFVFSLLFAILLPETGPGRRGKKAS